MTQLLATCARCGKQYTYTKLQDMENFLHFGDSIEFKKASVYSCFPCALSGQVYMFCSNCYKLYNIFEGQTNNVVKDKFNAFMQPNIQPNTKSSQDSITPVSGLVVQTSSQAVIAGYTVDISGIIVKISGNVIKISGQSIGIGGYNIGISGQSVIISGNAIQIKGVPYSGQPITGSGNITSSGNITGSGNIIQSQPIVMSSGNIIQSQPIVMSSGNIIQSQPISITIPSVPISGQQISSSSPVTSSRSVQITRGQVIAAPTSRNIIRTSGQAKRNNDIYSIMNKY